MYTLYFKRETKEVKVKRASKVQQNFPYTEEVTRYNDCYFTCLTRKPLIVKANEIVNEWIKEVEEELRELKDIKI